MANKTGHFAPHEIVWNIASASNNMKDFLFSFLRFFGVVALAFVLASEAVLGDELSGTPVEAPSIFEEISESPVEVPTDMTDAPSPIPTFKEGDAPVVFQPGDIAQPVFQSPVAPPPISEAGRIDGAWLVTSAAMILAAAF